MPTNNTTDAEQEAPDREWLRDILLELPGSSTANPDILKAEAAILAWHNKTLQEAVLAARTKDHMSWSIVYGIGYDPDNTELSENISTLRQKWSRDEAELKALQEKS